MALANVVNAFLTGASSLLQNRIVNAWCNNTVKGSADCDERVLYIEFLLMARLLVEAFGFSRTVTVESLAAIIKCYTCYNCIDTDVETLATYFNGETTALPTIEPVVCALGDYVGVADTVVYKTI